MRAEKLTQAILAKAFRGELAPTEAELARREGRDYEPASALLERIRAERVAPTAAETLSAAEEGAKELAMNAKTVREDLDFLVNNPKKSLGSIYHDAGSCWLLIDVAVKEIRKLRKQLRKPAPDSTRRKQ